MYLNLDSFCVNVEASIHEAVACMDESTLGIVVAVSEGRKLEGTITDGDVRRIMLANIDQAESIRTVLKRKEGMLYERPITGRAGADLNSYLRLLREHNLLHLPIVDESGVVVGLVTLDEFVPPEPLPLQAVIMAGGEGKRLRPLTEDTPKPMLRLGDRPLLEIMIEQLKNAGVGRVHVAMHHKPEKITEHFGDGQGFGVDITYVSEERPLGTAGALGLMDEPDETMLVVNGDILTDIDFRAMLSFHREHAAELTVAVRQYDIQLPYGVVECDGASVRGLTEKPVAKYFVNAGIYLLEPAVYRYLPKAERFDMTELIQSLLGAGRPVSSFPVREYWLDIGQLEDYEKAKGRVEERGTGR